MIMNAYPSRLVLEGVPRVGFYVHFSPFPGSLFAVLEYLERKPDYDYLMGVSGAAFRRLWNRDDGGNIDISYLGETPFRLVFNALGLEWRAVPAVKEAMFLAVVESINRGIPVISFGIIGPPEAGVVTGYDMEGQALIGWSYFQEQGEHTYEVRDWFESMMNKDSDHGLIVVGSPKPARPGEDEILKTSLEWALDLENSPARPGLSDHVAGLASYTAWADALEVDADYPAGDMQIMEQRSMVYGDQIVMLGERRNGAAYLRWAGQFAPQAAAWLTAAADFYDEVANLEGKLWRWPVTSNSDCIPGLSDPATRRDLAHYVRLAGQKEAQAVQALEQALRLMD
jgi:hypothetical protein